MSGSMYFRFKFAHASLCKLCCTVVMFHFMISIFVFVVDILNSPWDSPKKFTLFHQAKLPSTLERSFYLNSAVPRPRKAESSYSADVPSLILLLLLRVHLSATCRPDKA